MVETSTAKGAASRPLLGAQLSARLDRLPTLTSHKVWITLLTANLAFDAYANNLYPAIVPFIKKDLALTTGEIGWMISAFFIGMCIGGLVGGRLLDKFGRRRILILATAVFSIGAIATGFSGTFESMFAARVCTGIGVQTATAAVMVYIAEMFPSKSRGRFVSISTISWTLTGPVISLFALYVIPHGDPGAWRMMFMASGISLLLIPLIWFLMPESVRWLSVHGQFEGAEKVVEGLEMRALRHGPLAEPDIASAAVVVQEMTLRQVLRNKRILGAVAIIGLGLFGANLGLTLSGNFRTLIFSEVLNVDSTTIYTLGLIGSLIYISSPFLAMLVVDRMERKTLILCGSVLGTVPLIAWGIVTNAWAFMLTGTLAGILVGIVFTTFYAYIPEATPTEARGLGTGFIFTAGRVGAVLSGVVGAMIYSNLGRFGLAVTASVAFIAASSLLFLWGPRTTGRSLEGVIADEIEADTAVAGTAPTGRSS